MAIIIRFGMLISAIASSMRRLVLIENLVVGIDGIKPQNLDLRSSGHVDLDVLVTVGDDTTAVLPVGVFVMSQGFSSLKLLP